MSRIKFFFSFSSPNYCFRKKKKKKSIDEKWKGLTNTLSGHICSSLNFIDKTLTSEPILTFQTNELYLNSKLIFFFLIFFFIIIPSVLIFTIIKETSLSLKHGALPHESICTENLTPWVKLLPCQNEVIFISFISFSLFFSYSSSNFRLD